MLLPPPPLLLLLVVFVILTATDQPSIFFGQNTRSLVSGHPRTFTPTTLNKFRKMFVIFCFYLGFAHSVVVFFCVWFVYGIILRKLTYTFKSGYRVVWIYVNKLKVGDSVGIETSSAFCVESRTSLSRLVGRTWWNRWIACSSLIVRWPIVVKFL